MINLFFGTVIELLFAEKVNLKLREMKIQDISKQPCLNSTVMKKIVLLFLWLFLFVRSLLGK